MNVGKLFALQFYPSDPFMMATGGDKGIVAVWESDEQEILMGMKIYTCLYVFMFICLCLYLYMCISVLGYMCVCVCVYMYLGICVYLSIWESD